MKTSHTPGPWTVGNPEGKTFYIMVGGHTEIANLPHCRAMSESSYAIEDNSEREANARLIAAAPYLLVALEGLFEQCSMVHKHWGDGSNAKEADAAIAAARAAIAKATGQG
jgi:hypothetical protein